MTAILHSQRLSELVSARLGCTPGDDVAGIVLGPRRRDVFAALGVPVADWMRISNLADRRGEDHALDVLGDYIDVMVADRCRRPGDDLLSDLICFDVDGDGLTADDVRTIVIELVSS